MVLQDFTTWTEHDPDGEATVTATKIAISDQDFDGDCYVYKDYGENYWNGDFTHKFELTVTSGNVTAVVCWALSNVSTGFNDFAGTDPIMAIGLPSGEGDYTIAIGDYDMNVLDISVDLTFGTKYYITVTRVNNTYTAVIKTGSHNGTTVDTITVNINAVAFRYLYAQAEIVMG